MALFGMKHIGLILLALAILSPQHVAGVRVFKNIIKRLFRQEKEAVMCEEVTEDGPIEPTGAPAEGIKGGTYDPPAVGIKGVVCDVSTVDNFALVNIEGRGMDNGAAEWSLRLFETLKNKNITCSFVAQTEKSICVAVKMDVMEKAEEAAVKMDVMEKTEKAVWSCFDDQNWNGYDQSWRKKLKQIGYEAPCSVIAAVGDGMLQPDTAGKFFSALGKADVKILAIAGASDKNLSAFIRTEHSAKAVEAVNKALLK